MDKILVLGRNGQVGSELFNMSSSYPQYEFIFSDSATLNLSKLDKIREYILTKNFDSIINCAAYTAVDKAESECELADLINHQAVAELAKIAVEKNIKLIHISTDYVFNGKNFKPYEETDFEEPINHYGLTKHLGEQSILKHSDFSCIIIRTSWVFSEFGNNFVKTMLRLGKEKGSLGVVSDQIGSPTYARDLAKFILEILPKINNTQPEIYHYSNEGVASWYDFANEIFSYSKISCDLKPINTRQFPTPAKRPFYSLMSKEKVKNIYGIKIPHWKDSLHECLDKLNK